MNLLKLSRARPGAGYTAIFINAASIESVEPAGDGEYSSLVSLAGQRAILVRETPEQIADMLNPMRAFAGKRTDVGEAPEQDGRTALLVKFVRAVENSLGDAALNALAVKARKEVGEAALEQAA